jgi:drug/metabolite transporter (DMT)-like permease
VIKFLHNISAMTTPSLAAGTHKHHDITGLLLAIAGAIFFSAKAIVAKLLYREGIDAVTLIALRMLLAAPFFALMALATFKREPRMTRADAARIVLLGLLGYYLSSFLDFLGLQYISAGLERLILFLTPSFVLLLNVWVLKRHVTGRQWLSLAVAYAGIVLVFWHDVRVGGDAVALGAALVFGAAFSYAVYLIMSGEMVQRLGSLRLVSWAMLVSSAACLVQYALLRPMGMLFIQTPAVWGYSLLNATLCTVLPVVLTMMAVARIGAGGASQAGMIGPVSTLFLAYWLLSEPITTLQLAGTVLVMGGILILTHKKTVKEPAHDY